MGNPYAPPAVEIETDSVLQKRVPLRGFFFVVNFSAAMLMAAACFVSVIFDQTSPDYIIGMLLFVPVVVYGVCEWLAYYRDKRSIERRLGVANVVLGAFFALESYSKRCVHGACIILIATTERLGD